MGYSLHIHTPLQVPGSHLWIWWKWIWGWVLLSELPVCPSCSACVWMVSEGFGSEQVGKSSSGKADVEDDCGLVAVSAARADWENHVLEAEFAEGGIRSDGVAVRWALPHSPHQSQLSETSIGKRVQQENAQIFTEWFWFENSGWESGVCVLNNKCQCSGCVLFHNLE